MANTTFYNLQFAGVSFVEDVAKSVALSFDRESPNLREEYSQSPIRNQQPEIDLIEEIDRIMPFDFLQDFEYPTGTMGRRGNALACWSQAIQDPVHINTWYYPNSASRWSIFRGLATEKMYQQMLDQSDDQNLADLEMMCLPIGPTNPNPQAEITGISSEMYLFIGRPIAKTKTQYDGLYLLTFVDERYFFQGTPVPELTINQNTQWTDIITECIAALGITFIMPNIPTAYGQPEPDSQLWSQYENASTLLDAIALNLGMVVVRGLDGTYQMLSPLESKTLVESNRGTASTVVRMMGGNIFSLTNDAIREAVVPSNIHVAFPQYVLNPVPHFMNSRYTPQRPSCMFEDGFGGNYTVSTPILSGPPLVEGLTGVSDLTIWNTAKAIQNLESDTTPLNSSGLTALALQISTDVWNYKVAAALDETYPGIIDWVPDGLHDIVWTYSSKKRVAGTRVLRGSWNNDVKDMQHGSPTYSGLTNTPIGVGGPSVAQSWRDSFSISGSVSNTTLSNIASGGNSVQFNAINNFPTQNRWRGIINSGQSDQEICYFEGTSGSTAVNIVYRGIDGTTDQSHTAGSVVQQVIPNNNYGVNLVKFEKGQYTYPGIWSSGGLQEQVIIPQVQTVQCLCNSGALVNSISSYSGQVLVYDPTQQSGLQFVAKENVWIQERNNSTMNSGALYEGQFAGFSAGLPSVNPIYLVNAFFFNTVTTALFSRKVRIEDVEGDEPPRRSVQIYPTYTQDAPTAVRRRLWEDELVETPKRTVQIYPTYTQDPPTSVRRRIVEEEIAETPIRKISVFPTQDIPLLGKRTVWEDDIYETPKRPVQLYIAGSLNTYNGFAGAIPQTFSGAPVTSGIISGSLVASGVVVSYTSIPSGNINDPSQEWSGGATYPADGSGGNRWVASQDGWRVFIAALTFLNNNFTAVFSGNIRFHLDNLNRTSGQDINLIRFTTNPTGFGGAKATLNLGLDRFFYSGDTLQVWIDFNYPYGGNPPDNNNGLPLLWHTHQSGNLNGTSLQQFP